MSHKKSIPPKNPVYLIMNKPKGYVCSTVSDRHKTVYELLPEEYKHLNTVGRLDSETTGLLIFTNDGMYNHQLTSPENHISKTYEIILEKEVTEKEQEDYKNQAEKGILLPAEKKAPEYFAKDMHLEWISTKKCLLTIKEGKFHQVRRTFIALGNKVLELKRIKIGNLELKSLQEGEITLITKDSVF